MTSAMCSRTGVPVAYCSCSLHDRIGGKLSAAGYAALANKHRPDDDAGLAAAARDLARQGLTTRDISQALQVTEDVIVALLQRADTQSDAARGDQAAAIHWDVWTGQRGSE